MSRPFGGRLLLLSLLILVGCATRPTDAKAESVRQAHLRDSEAIRIRLLHATAGIIAGQRVTDFSIVQTAAQEWDAHIGVEHPGTEYRIGVATAIAPGDRYITAAHCVVGQPITILRFDRQMQPHALQATIVWSDTIRDLALVSAPGCDDLPTLTIAKAQVGVGDPVTVLGNWDELSAGKVVGVLTDPTELVTSAPTRPGDSGGPIVDQHGDLMGVVSRGLSRGFWKTEFYTIGALLKPADILRDDRQLTPPPSAACTPPPVSLPPP